MTRLQLAALLVIAGCGGSTPAPPPRTTSQPADAGIDAPLDQDLPRLAARSVKLFEAVDRAFAAAGEDCAAATTKLGELATQYADVIAAQRKVQQDGRGMELKLALRQYEPQLEQTAKAIMAGKTLPACSQDEAFARAFDQLGGSPP